jgi:O-antigen ligase
MSYLNRVSPAILIPIIWMLRISSRGIMYWFNPGAGLQQDIDYLKGSPVDRTFFILLEVTGIIILLARNIEWKVFFKKNIMLISLYAFMGVSVLWSDFPDVSFKRWIRTIGDLVMVIIILSDTNLTSAFVRSFRYWAYLLVPLSLLLVKYFRTYGVSYDFTGEMEMWIGVTTHKNSLGQLVCFCSLFFVWIFSSKRYKTLLTDIPVFLIALWLLNGSETATSRTSLSVFITGICILFLLKLLKTSVLPIKVMAVILVSGFFLGIVLTPYIISYQFIPFIIAKTGGDPTLTGRTYLWDALLEIGKENPLLGVGYGGFWIGEYANDLWKTFTWGPGQAHNGYIDVYIDIGIVGIILLSLTIITAFKSIMIHIRAGSDYGRFRLLMLVTILIYNFTESSFCKPTSLPWFVFLLISVITPEELPEENNYEIT